MVNAGITQQGYVPAEEAAKLFGVTENCLARWRSANKGPTYYRLAGRIYYRKEDIQAFIERSRIETVSEIDNCKEFYAK
jgi:hypothetical protein